MDWTASELRQLRYRLGWSRAEMARSMGCEVTQILGWEAGTVAPTAAHRARLVMFFTQVEANSEKVRRRPVAELIMENRGLDQVHDSEVRDTLKSFRIPLK